jgi:hypothetical protein
MAPKKNKEKKDINYKLGKTAIVDFFEYHYSRYGLTPENIKSCDLEYSLSYNVNADQESIGFKLSATFFKISEDDNKNELFGIVSEHVFKCYNLKDHFSATDEERIDVPNGFLEELLKAAFHGTRGMLYAQVNNPVYKNMFLPLPDFSEILQKLREQTENA